MSLSIGPALRKYWRLLSAFAAGRWLFSRFLGLYAPYSGSIRAQVERLQPGHGVVVLKERRRVRNHLKSIHAIALVNLAEMVTGLTLMNSLPDKTRGILVAIDMQFLKKARGRLVAECDCEIPPDNAEREVLVNGVIKNAQGEIVATAQARWLLGPEK